MVFHPDCLNVMLFPSSSFFIVRLLVSSRHHFTVLFIKSNFLKLSLLFFSNKNGSRMCLKSQSIFFFIKPGRSEPNDDTMICNDIA